MAKQRRAVGWGPIRPLPNKARQQGLNECRRVDDKAPDTTCFAYISLVDSALMGYSPSPTAGTRNTTASHTVSDGLRSPCSHAVGETDHNQVKYRVSSSKKTYREK